MELLEMKDATIENYQNMMERLSTIVKYQSTDLAKLEDILCDYIDTHRIDMGKVLEYYESRLKHIKEFKKMGENL